MGRSVAGHGEEEVVHACLIGVEDGGSREEQDEHEERKCDRSRQGMPWGRGLQKISLHREVVETRDQ